VTDQPYADAVGELLDQDYRLEDITQAEVIHQALDRWLAEQTQIAIDHHAATNGNEHQAKDRCESWYALHDALTLMHDNSRRFVMELLAPKEGA
jgi:hypothetical protein